MVSFSEVLGCLVRKVATRLDDEKHCFTLITMFLCDHPPPFSLISSLIPRSLPIGLGMRLFTTERSPKCYCFCSGFWGVLCVGIFSKQCLIRELYEDLCFCLSTQLPTAVSTLRRYMPQYITIYHSILLYTTVVCSTPWYITKYNVM